MGYNPWEKIVLFGPYSETAISPNESKLGRLYRYLWEWWPGRPWTYAIRDSWHKYQLLYIFALLLVGVVLGHFAYPVLLWVGLTLLLGVCLGHLWW